MSEVKRFYLDATNGRRPEMVESPEGYYCDFPSYDAAQSELVDLTKTISELSDRLVAGDNELAALREELAEYQKILASYKNNYVTKLAYNAVQSSLTAAEQRNAELVELLKRIDRTPLDRWYRDALNVAVAAAIKPTESGASE